MKPETDVKSGRSGAPRVLVIEDEVSVARVVVMLLKVKGLDVSSAQTGAEGLILLEREKWDLVLCDYNLPDMTAADLCWHLKRRARMIGLPLIVMSGRVLEAEATENTDRDAAGFISKPFQLEAFYSTVFSVLNRGKESPELNIPPILSASGELRP